MKIATARNPDKCPATRRALLAHLWAKGLNVNIWREGPLYVMHAGSVLSATHCRRISSLTFAQWENYAKNAPRARTDYC